jgi:D-alanine transaminase
MRLIELARKAGVRVEERPFTAEEAKAAREAFLTSTTAFVLPVVQIDDAVIGNGRPGSAALELRRIYEEFALRG